jgi:hypothetical protein
LFGGLRAAELEGSVAVALQVVVDVQGIDFAAVFQDDAAISWRATALAEERACEARAGCEPAPPPEVAPDDEVGGFDCYVAVEGYASVGIYHLHQRFEVAHSVAADRFDLRGLLQDVAYGLGAAGDAAGAHANPNFDSSLHAV